MSKFVSMNALNTLNQFFYTRYIDDPLCRQFIFSITGCPSEAHVAVAQMGGEALDVRVSPLV